MVLVTRNGNENVSRNDTDDESRSYDVLYYKRKNKAHKSKGVVKMDGRLVVQPHPSCVALLYQQDDTPKPVFSGIQRAISKRAFGGDDKELLQVNDIVILGHFECEIVNVLSPNCDKPVAATAATPAATAAVPPTRRCPMKTLSSKKTFPLGTKRPLVSAATLTTVVASVAQRPVMASSTVQSKQGQQHRKPPPQPKRTYGSDSPDDEDDLTKSMLARRPMIASKTNKLLTTKRRKVVGTTSAHQAPSTTSVSSIQFPGAIGNVVVPPSICKVLRPHQVDGITFLWNCLTGTSPQLKQSCVEQGIQPCRGAILADEMGLGKTLMTISTLFALHRRQKEKRFIVVCPSSLVSNWAKEFDKWIGKASQPKRVVVRKGGEQGLQQIRAFCHVKPHQSEVLIISYELFRMNASVINTAKQIELVVVDEGHRLKNSAGSLTLTALNGLQTDARLLISGTPIQNNLTEFHTVANFVCPGLLGDLASFRKVYERPISAANSKSANFEKRARGHAQSQALDNITKTFMLRRLQKDILKSLLPPRKELLLFCRPSLQQRELYKAIAAKTLSSSTQSGATAEALTVLASLRKLCSHPALLEQKAQGVVNAKQLALSGKLEVLDALLSAAKRSNPDDKVVLVSNFTSALSLIEDVIFKPKGWPYLRLDGAIAQSERQPLVDSFNRCSPDKAFGFLLSSKAGGCGLNLIGANRLVMFDADFNPATDMQAMARIYRQGQTKPCFIYRMFTAGTVEEVVYQRQVQKGNLATITVDGSSSAETSSAKFTKEELRDCFTLKEDCNCDTKRKVGKRWPEYDGAASLKAQDCDDAPLLAVANDQTSPLSFVHVVPDDEIVLAPSEDLTEQAQAKNAPDQEDGSSDEEFEFVDEEDDSNGKDERHGNDSDEEREFEE